MKPKHPSLANAREAILLEEAQRRARRTRGDDEIARISRAMALAPTLDVCKALLRGESVPISSLDLHWVRRLGLKPNNGR